MWRNVAFVIPCYNDFEHLTKVVKELPAESLKIIVDDGSINTFSETVKEISHVSRCIIIRHCFNLGQGAALETGFEYIRRKQNEIECIFTFDADGQHNFQDAELMLRSIHKSQSDIILGSRFLDRRGFAGFKGGGIKFIILKSGAFVSRFTLGMALSDRHNGLRLLNRNALEVLTLENTGYGHADEILRRIQDSNLSYEECPVTINYRIEKKRRGQSTFNVFKLLFDRFWGGA